jgi:hypothetical protein
MLRRSTFLVALTACVLAALLEAPSTNAAVADDQINSHHGLAHRQPAVAWSAAETW